MDIFTHAVAISMFLYATGYTVFIPFGVLGAVIIDIDMAFFFLPRKYPSLYLLHHAGFSHSFFGATILSVIAFLTSLALYSRGWLPGTFPGGLHIPALAVTFAGAYLHLFLDWLAAPGLPLLYPLTEKRFGLAMTPMPLYFLLTLLALGILGMVFFQGLTAVWVEVYGAIFAGIILVSATMKWLVYRSVPGRSYYTFQPFKWVIIREGNLSYTVTVYHTFRGVIRKLRYEKYRNITPEEANSYHTPEVRRQRYFSYVVVVEKRGNEIFFHDPVREQGFLSYPPWYPSVMVNTREAAS